MNFSMCFSVLLYFTAMFKWISVSMDRDFSFFEVVRIPHEDCGASTLASEINEDDVVTDVADAVPVSQPLSRNRLAEVLQWEQASDWVYVSSPLFATAKDYYHSTHAAAPKQKSPQEGKCLSTISSESPSGYFAAASGEISSLSFSPKNSKGWHNKNQTSVVKSVGILEMFKHADFLDNVLILAGTIGSFIDGSGLSFYVLLFGKFINSFGFEKAKQHDLNKLCLYMILLAVISFFGCYLEVTCWTRAADRQARRIRTKYIRAVLRQDISFFDGVSTGELLQSMSQDVSVIQAAIGNKMAGFACYTSTFISGYLVGFISSWQLSLVLLAVTPVMLVAGKVQASVYVNLFTKQQEAYAEAGTVAQQAIASVKTVQSYGTERRICKKYEQLLRKSSLYGIKAGFIRGAGIGSVYLVVYGAWGLGLWYGSQLIAHGKSKSGQVIACLFAVITAGRGIGIAASYVASIYEGAVAASRVFQVIERIPPIDIECQKGKAPAHCKGHIQFQNIVFAYPLQLERLVLNYLSLEIAPGQTVALVGPSGSGKSTLFSLLQRFYDPLNGFVLVDGVDVRDYNLQWLRQQMGLVGQEPVLYATSIADNILYGDEDAGMEQVFAAAETAYAYSFIMELPEKFSTQVGESGMQLSGGQRQRIAIARAVLRDPTILLLDEATSSLDTVSERIVQRALNKLMAGRSAMIIAHRLSTIQHADLIVVVAEGKIYEQGNHQELMEKRGKYYDLINATKSEDNSSHDVSSKAEVLEPSFSSSQNTKPEEGQIQLIGAGNKKLSRVFEISRKQLPLMLLGSFSSIHAGAILPIHAYLLGSVAAAYLANDKNKMLHEVGIWASISLALGVAAVLYMAGQHGLLNWSSIKITKEIRTMVLFSVLKQDLGWFEEEGNNSGRILHCLMSSAASVGGLINDKILVWTMVLTTLTVGLIICATIDWKMMLLASALMPLLVAAGYVRYSTIASNTGAANSSTELYAKACNIAVEAITNIKTVTAFSSQKRVQATFDASLGAPIKLSFTRSQVTGLASGLAESFRFLSYTGLLWSGALLVRNDETDYERVLKVFLIFVVSSHFLGQLMSMAPDSSKSSLAVKSVLRIVDAKPKIDPDDDGLRLKEENMKGEIVFDRVEFAYPSRREVKVLKGFSLRVEGGSKVAICGESGRGKSTIFNLLQRFYNPDSGRITLDGVDIRECDLKWLRRRMAVVSQEPVIFNATVHDNIAYGWAMSEAVGLGEVEGAARIANAHSFISALPDGYKTMIGGKGEVQLSGGQKQRICIARALIRRKLKVLLLDEATSGLDSESESEVRRGLEMVLKKRQSSFSVVMVAHRLSWIRSAGCIAVMDGGRICELGSHEQLISNPEGLYYRLASSQSIAI